MWRNTSKNNALLDESGGITYKPMRGRPWLGGGIPDTGRGRGGRRRRGMRRTGGEGLHFFRRCARVR
eukprot:328859-Pyramimonas_sp.AAC.1